MFSNRLELWGLTFLLVITTSSLAAQNQRAIAIVIDTSGSMKMMGTEVKNALIEFIEGLQLGAHVVLVRFDIFSNILANLTLKSDEDKKFLIDQMQSLEFRGAKTNFDEAIKGAEAGLFRAGITKDATIVIFSDGLSDPSPEKPIVNLILLAKQVFPQLSGYNIYLIGITADQTTNYKRNENVMIVEVPAEGIQSVLQRIQEDVREPDNNKKSPSMSAKTPLVKAKPLSRWMPNWQWLFYMVILALLAIGIVRNHWRFHQLFKPILLKPLFGVHKSRSVKVRTYGSDDEQEAFLFNGESITLGRRQEIPLPTDSVAVLTHENGLFQVRPRSPEKDKIAIIRDGKEIPVEKPAILCPDDLIQIGDLQIEVDFSASKANLERRWA